MDKGPLEDGAEKEDTRMKRGLALFLAALLTALTLTACGGSAGGNSSASSADHWEEDNWKAEAEELGFGASAAGGAPAEPQETPQVDAEDGAAQNPLANAKMVYTADMEAETMDYDACAAGLEALVEEAGGYLEYASTGSYGDGRRNGHYTVRIPAAQFHGFLKRVGEIGHIVSKSQYAENISERYYDTESRLLTQKTKMERLQALLAKAEKMEDIIALESAIAETELQIEQLTGSLRHYDALVDFATVEIQLREVLRLSTVEEAPPTFASRLGNAFAGGLRSFGDFLQDLAIFLAYNWIWLVLLALVLLLVVRISKRRQARRGETFREAAQREPWGPMGFRRKKDGKNPDDKTPKD